MAAEHNVEAYATAIEAKDAAALRALILASDFILINVPGEDDDEEGMGALTADIDDTPVLVAFSTEDHAGTFVGAMSDMFDEVDEVHGFLVEGDALLEYLPEDYGLLIDPETDDIQLIGVEIAKHIVRDDA